MDSQALGPLRVRRVVTNGNAAASGDEASPLTIVLMHGFGAGGDDLVGLAGALDVPAGTEFIFPEAVHRLQDMTAQPMFGDARAWWLIDIGRFERAIARGELQNLSAEVPEGLSEARSKVSAMLDALSSEPAQAHRRLVLGGFSQGAMLALDVALRDTARKLAGLVLFSGTMIAEREWLPLMKERKDTPVFQSHGEIDSILPFEIAVRLRDALAGAGVDVTFDPFHGPHTIAPRSLQRVSVWLRALPER